MTPKEYAQVVNGYAKYPTHPLFPGKHYTDLARLLLSPYVINTTDNNQPPPDGPSQNSIHVYDLAVEQGKAGRHGVLETLDQLDTYDDNTRKKQSGGRLLFFQGYMHPLWLNHAGTKFDIDPEFYLRHLESLLSQPIPDYYPMLSLPSCADVIRIRFTSIMKRNDLHASARSATATLRSMCQDHMSDYLGDIRARKGVVASDSLVRQFSVFDHYHFAVEQMATIYVNYDSPGWTGMINPSRREAMQLTDKSLAFVWIDFGRGLHLSEHGPWKELTRNHVSTLTVQPIIQYRKQSAFREGTRPPSGSKTTCHPLASAYGSSLHAETMQSDTFYALDELFRLAVASESQLLTLLSHKIKKAIADDQIEDLHHALSIIEDHRIYIRENLTTVKSGGDEKWPKAPGDLRPRATTAKESLRRDFEHLAAFSEHLAERCAAGIAVLMNEAMFRQSKRAVEQTEATVKLSVLVFLFAPLSLTTSVFSMSVREIENGNLSVWVWAITSVVVLVITFIIWQWNLVDVVRATWLKIRHAISHSPKKTL